MNTSDGSRWSLQLGLPQRLPGSARQYLRRQSVVPSTPPTPATPDLLPNTSDGSRWSLQLDLQTLQSPQIFTTLRRTMFLTPYSSLKWAYQLHYSIRFRTSRRIELFLQREDWLQGMLEEICVCHDYHLLEQRVTEN